MSKVPADKVPVKDPSNLTDAEKIKSKTISRMLIQIFQMVLRSMLLKTEQRRSPSQMAQLKVIPGTDLVRPEADADKNNVKVPADKRFQLRIQAT